jgi:AraC family transcriptional regulator of adaptative response/methylated-DNA-[protein]-cysteine methyltransferase
MASGTDYERVERAIRFIASRAPRQPSLAEVARHVGLSEFHFQRLFARWAGISPKKFAQYLTIEHAKVLLRRSRSILDASFASGLSGSGRLHDLFVTVEAVTPGEFRSGGAGITIEYGVHESPFGDILFATTRRGICAMHFLRNGSSERGIVEALRLDWPSAAFVANRHAASQYAGRMFGAGERAREAPVPLLFRGTNFQINVWKALLRVPAGAAVTYEQLALLAGTPRAVRAVGTAVGSNPLSFIVPCHRVIRKSGEFGNYGGGVERKQAMLVWESARFGGDDEALTDA